MKLKDFLEVVHEETELSICDKNDSVYHLCLLHKVKKDEIFKEHRILLNYDIYYVFTYWYDDEDATLGIVLM